jgi:prepilin-type N-terminal cleavage/methylation domain-containing protein
MLLSGFLNNKNKGFTLIELLVVISIIGLLSTVVLASVQKVRTDAKWRKFDSELYEIRTAIQLYRENNNGNWPTNMVSGDSFLDLLLELKNAGVYPSNTIAFPQDMYIGTTNGLKTGGTFGASCGLNNYKDVYYVIYFQGTNLELLNTKALNLYEYSSDDGGLNFHLDYSWDRPLVEGDSETGYMYCIDFK